MGKLRVSSIVPVDFLKRSAGHLHGEELEDLESNVERKVEYHVPMHEESLCIYLFLLLNFNMLKCHVRQTQITRFATVNI